VDSVAALDLCPLRGLIGLAYYSIPVALWYFVRRRTDLPFTWIFVMFAVFIFACGTTHLIAVWKIWQPVYWLRRNQDGHCERLAGHCHVALAVDAQGALAAQPGPLGAGEP
jgi:hypothetical protein